MGTLCTKLILTEHAAFFFSFSFSSPQTIMLIVGHRPEQAEWSVSLLAVYDTGDYQVSTV